MTGIEHPLLLDLPVPIRTKRLMLRPCRAGDGAAMNEAITESLANFAPWLEWANNPAAAKDGEEKARKFAADFILRKHLSFGIFRKNRFLGMIGIYSINWKIPSASLGYWLRTSETGKGYMTEGVSAVSLYAFRVLCLHRLAILCDENNVKSSAIPERLGFTLEARAPMAGVHPLTGEPTADLTYVRFSDEGLLDEGVSWGA